MCETMKPFSKHWISSAKPRKQRKYSYAAPLHLRQKLMRVHLSKELRIKYGKRNVLIHKGDTVKVMRGQFARKTGKVDTVALKRGLVFVAGMETVKKDGSKVPFPLHHSYLLITELDLTDKLRKAKLEQKPVEKSKVEKSTKGGAEHPQEKKQEKK